MDLVTSDAGIWSIEILENALELRDEGMSIVHRQWNVLEFAEQHMLLSIDVLEAWYVDVDNNCLSLLEIWHCIRDG